MKAKILLAIILLASLLLSSKQPDLLALKDAQQQTLYYYCSLFSGTKSGLTLFYTETRSITCKHQADLTSHYQEAHGIKKQFYDEVGIQYAKTPYENTGINYSSDVYIFSDLSKQKVEETRKKTLNSHLSRKDNIKLVLFNPVIDDCH